MHDHVTSFLKTFFEENDCKVNLLKNGKIDINLTEKIDKAIMNRPFYWHYMKSTNQLGEPARLKLYTSVSDQFTNRQWIHFGTPLMNDICAYLAESSRFIQAFERLNVQKQTPLHPWLLINVVISFKGYQLKQHVQSIGLNLITGVMIDQAMEMLHSKSLQPTISPHCYIISPLIKLESGFQRIEHYVNHYLQGQNYTWMVESLVLLKEELLLLKYFHEQETKKEHLISDVIQLYERVRPEINIDIINGGIFYLAGL